MRKACIDMVHVLAKRDPRVVYIGSDPGAGTADSMRKEFPERFFIEGISEAHVIGMSAGMAFEGYLPYVNTIATFITRRCFEQVAVDLCLHSLPVRLIGNGGGLVYAPLGPTHVAMEDIAIMRALPSMTVVCPTDAEEMKRFMEQTLDWPQPIYIRLGKGGDPVTSQPEEGFEIGKAIVKRDPGRVLIVTTGIMVHHVLAAGKLLAARGIRCGVAHFHTVKPLDEETLLDLASGVEAVVTVEEHTRIGGLGSAVLECMADRMTVPKPVLRLGLPDRFTHNYGSQDSLLKHYGLDAEGIAASVERFIAAPSASAAPKASAPSLEHI
jgi:transketolase